MLTAATDLRNRVAASLSTACAIVTSRSLSFTFDSSIALAGSRVDEQFRDKYQSVRWWWCPCTMRAHPAVEARMRTRPYRRHRRCLATLANQRPRRGRRVWDTGDGLNSSLFPFFQGATRGLAVCCGCARAP